MPAEEVAAVRIVLIVIGVVAVFLVLGLVVRLTGYDDPGTGRFDPPPPTQAAPDPDEAGRISGAADAYFADIACRGELSAVTDRLTRLDALLGDGLAYDPYEARVRAARRAMTTADVEALPPACREGVAADLEAALTAYERAGRVWLRCIKDPACPLDDIDPRLEQEWAEAARQLEAART
ncbi:MAG: hypothetical protein AB7I08_05305 [Thermoleophilia bacterium]